MAAVGKFGQTVSVSPVGGGLKSASADGVASEWLPAASDEEAMLHQLRAALLQARDTPPGESPCLIVVLFMTILNRQPPSSEFFMQLLRTFITLVCCSA